MDILENPVQNEEKPKTKLVKTVLDNFGKLSNPHENVRVKSATNLLKHLVENNGAEEGLDELKYALKRLIRGLGAPTPLARAGYYSTLVALLNLNFEIGPNDILEIVKSELHKSGKNSDGENADICAGQILACGAIIRGSLWDKSEPAHKKELLQILLTACKERTYLKLFGYSFIVELINQVSELSTDKSLLTQINEEVSMPWTDQTLDSLYLLLKLKLAYPDTFNKKFLKKILEVPEIVCEDSLERICNILMAIPRASSLQHPIFESIVLYLTPTILPGFFNELDIHLKTPNRNRLLVFIKLLSNTLSHSFNNSDEYFNQIPKLLTRNFITQLLGYFRTFKGKQKDKEYHDACQKLFEILCDLFKNEKINSDVKISVIKKLLFDPGTFVFEKVTKSKAVQQITASLDSEGVKNLALVYKRVVDGTENINSENDSEIWINNDRLYSAHLLIKLLSLPIMKQENDWKADQLIFLLEMSILKERNSLNIGRELAESLKTAFFGALDLKLARLEELQKILSRIVHYLDEKLNPENLNIILRTSFPEETYEIWKKTLQTVNKIEKKQKKKSTASVFLTLFLHMGLQLFNDVKLAMNSLNELFSCYQRIKTDKRTKHSLDNSSAEITIMESQKDPLWIEVVTDLFLNLLSHNSHLLRSVINSVFPHLCQYLTSSSIHQILMVIDPKNDDNPLSKNEDSDSNDEHNDSSESEESEAENESETEGEDEDEMSGDETVTDKLRMALHQVLINGASMSDNESVDLDQMSDTEGEKLDEALANAFKQFKPNRGKRRKQTKDQETLTHFRVRVLDLIEIYLDSNPSMLLSLEIMLPLLQALEFSIRDEHQNPLNVRLKHILKKLLGLKKFSDIEGVNDNVLAELLKSLLDKGSKNVLIVQEMGEQISNCCIFIIKCSEIIRGIENTPSKIKKHLKNNILEVIKEELSQFFTKRDSLTPYVLFKNLLQLSWEGNIKLAIILLDFMFSSEIRQFKKNQVSELLKIFYTNQRFISQYNTKIQNKMKEAHEKFGANVIQFLKDLSQQPTRKDIKEKYICNFFNLLTALKQSQLAQNNISWSDIAHNVREYRSYKSFSRDAKVAFNKLCRVLGVSNIVSMKQCVTKLASVLDNEDEDSELQEQVKIKEPKKHKRKSNETLKLKKEAKQLRLNSLSTGLGKVEFEDTQIYTEISADGNNDVLEDMQDVSEEVKRNKKKEKAKSDEGLDQKNGQTTRKEKRRVEEMSQETVIENGIKNHLNTGNSIQKKAKKEHIKSNKKKLKLNNLDV